MTLDQQRQQLQQLREQVDAVAPCRERSRALKELDQAARRLEREQPADRKLVAIGERASQWQQQLDERRAALPTITYPQELPVVERRADIAQAIAEHQVVIVAGETGSGKTTQLPKICLELGRGQRGLIGHTQPRRLAARTVAHRIAEELQTEPGGAVGYQVRFNDRTSPDSYVKLMTDGILLAEIQHDRQLLAYDTLIIDEAHERSLNIDFLLGYLKQLLPRRPDLKLIITSATIDVERFARHFDDAPVLEVSGRTFPVQTVYCDSQEHGGTREEQIDDLLGEISAGHYGPRGDVLVFLPGERDIRELARQLRRREDLDILPLYARLSQAEQDRVFKPTRRRGLRVVLATNVAETSLTVPGIRYVIDPGDARISRYSFRTKVQRLPIEPISQASANQRQGRCGRIAEGVCLRLYSEQDFLGRPEFTDPEIRRTNLAAVILQMLRLGLGDVGAFPFIDPPDPRMVRDGYRLLEELGAVENDALTALGRQMSALPVDPRMARMLLAAQSGGCLAELLVIASALSIQDPRERPAEKQAQSDQAHARFAHERSDFLAYLNLWHYYEEQRQALSQNQLRKLCQREFLAYMRMREWRDTHYQLTLACRALKLGPLGEPRLDDGLYEAIHTALLSGLLGNIAQFQEGREYLGSRNRKLQIFPGSSQSRRKPAWLVAAEIVETSKVFARTVAQIDPRWVLQINPALLKHHYYQPGWQARSGRAMAYERVSLFGLTVADKRRVHYGPINPVEARELLIREALIGGRLQRKPAFLRHNQSVLERLEGMESRLRRRDVVADEQVQFDFYAERLPADCYTLSRLNGWLKREEGAERLLRFDASLLQLRDPGVGFEQQYPDRLEWGDLHLPLSYRFEPGKAGDGVTVTVPVALLNRVPRFRFDWLVPGLLRDKCIALLKGLPKALRKQLVPVPDFVDRALAQLQPVDESLTGALARVLSQLSSQQIRPEDFDASALDEFYRMNIEVVDARGVALAQGRDLASLVERFRDETRESVAGPAADSPARRGIQRWDFETIPNRYEFTQAGQTITAYPALVPESDGSSAAIELLDYPQDAELAQRRGVITLLRGHNPQPVKYLRKQLLRGNHFNLLLAGAGLDRVALVDECIDAAVIQLAGLHSEAPRERAEFERAAKKIGSELVSIATEIEQHLGNALEPLAAARRLAGDYEGAAWAETIADVNTQIEGLFAPGHVGSTPFEWLAQYPRYCKALLQRLERLRGQQNKDLEHTRLLGSLAEPLAAELQKRPSLLQLSEAALRYRWMLEELRVSLFAQALGTRFAVSRKRCEEQWVAVEQWLSAHPL